jgi:hypothetical protein
MTTSKTSSKSVKKLPVKELIIPLAFGALGAVALVRGLWNSSRALVSRGTLKKCAGPGSFGCDPADVIVTTKGEVVYSMAPGKVLARGDDFVHILSSYEPVILYYGGIAPSVTEGSTVSLGQAIGVSGGELSFAVTGFQPLNKVVAIVPGAWLTARGLQHIAGNSSTEYCNTGRSVKVPADVKNCGFSLPAKPGFSILPISVDMV